MPGNLGNVAHSRLLGFAVSNGLAGFFVPHNARIDLLFLALRVGGRSRFYPQIAHAQEHAVFFDEERRFGMISQEVRRFPALFENLAHDSQSKRAVGRRMNGNEPVGFRSHGAVGDVDDYELGAGIAGLEIKMRALLVRHRSVTTPDHMMVSVGNVRSTVSGRAGAEHVGPRHGRGDIAVRQNTARPHDIEQTRHDGAFRGSSAKFGGVATTQEERNGRGTKLVNVLLPLIGDFGDGLVPGDTLELSRATFADATHGILQTLRAVYARRLREPLGADAVEFRAVLEMARRGADDLPVANMDIQIAALAALGAAGTGEDLRLGGSLLRFGFFQVLGLGAAAYQRACRRQRRRTLDEAPAGEPMRCLFSHVCSSLFHSSAARPSDARPSQIAGRGSRSAKGGVKSLVPLAFHEFHFTERRRILR
nr:FIG00624297: hypothetical protein [uncultured bacterium]